MYECIKKHRTLDLRGITNNDYVITIKGRICTILALKYVKMTFIIYFIFLCTNIISNVFNHC